jgi:hypothetical protein
MLQLDFATTNLVAALVMNGASQPVGFYNATRAPTYIAGTGTLQIGTPSVIACKPTNITFSVSGNTLSLSWPADHLGWLVQSNSVNLAVPADCRDISGTAAATNYNITVNPGQTNVFYRLRMP